MDKGILEISGIDGVFLSCKSDKPFLIQINFKWVKTSDTYIESDIIFEAIQ